MKKIIAILLLALLCASTVQAETIKVLYNEKAKIVNTHYNAPGKGSLFVIITADVLMPDGRYVKCIDSYMSGAAFIGFGPLYRSPFGDHGWTHAVLPWAQAWLVEATSLRLSFLLPMGLYLLLMLWGEYVMKPEKLTLSAPGKGECET